MTFKHLGTALLACVLAAPAAAGTLEVWVRQPGEAGVAPERGVVARFDPSTLPAQDLERFDVQYGFARRYKALPLAELLKALAPPRDVDTALLHFANGMTVPVALATPPDVLIAFGDFPPVYKGGDPARDRRPIKFAGNKVVAATLDHPDVPTRLRDGGFSPWRHVDTLVGVELAKRASWNAQFSVPGDARVKNGETLFRQVCSYCHSARKIGGRLGWDVVTPMPAAELRADGERLYEHVAFRSGDAGEKGLMMPAIKQLTPDEAADVHAWLKAVAANPQAAYRP